MMYPAGITFSANSECSVAKYTRGQWSNGASNKRVPSAYPPPPPFTGVRCARNPYRMNVHVQYVETGKTEECSTAVGGESIAIRDEL